MERRRPQGRRTGQGGKPQPPHSPQLYTLLTKNYVEDEEGNFRFDYSIEFLRWTLLVPNYKPNWHIGVRLKKNNKLVGFISGVPLKLCIDNKPMRVCEINFLCVFNKLRKYRLAPVLIKEVTRRVNLKGIFQAVYTAGVELPKPITKTRYFHRSLNPTKLIEVSPPPAHLLDRLLFAPNGRYSQQAGEALQAPD